MNRFIAAGNLAKNATIHTNAAGDRDFMALTIACNEGKDKNGNPRPAEFVDATIWGKKGQFDKSAEYFTVGQPVLAVGKLVYPPVTDKNEKDGVIYQSALLEIANQFDLQLTGSKNTSVAHAGDDTPVRDAGSDQAGAAGIQQAGSQPAPQPAPDFDSFDDDIPF
jgi:single-strand DNA-binding protein